MIAISLTDFVDFLLTIPASHLAKVKEIANRGKYDPKNDFWKPLREGIQDFHQKGTSLDSVLAEVKDPKKMTRYPSSIKGYKKFIGKKKIEWFKPPTEVWTFNDLSVRVNPELGLKIGENKFVTKLYFKDEKPTKPRLRIVFELMRSGLSLEDGVTPAVIDVSNSRLICPKTFDEDLSALLEAQALAFQHLWKSVKVSKK